jgi:hypothetical protein
MFISDIKLLVDAHTGKTDTYSAAIGLLNLNNALYRVETRYMMSAGDWKYDNSNHADLPIATTSLVASQQDYSLPVETIIMDRIEVSYDGTTWYRATPMNISDNSIALTTANISSEYSKSAPQYQLKGRSIMIYPIPDQAVTGGLKVYGERFHDAFTSTDWTTNPTTVALGMDVNWQEQVAREMSLNHLLDNDMSRYNTMLQAIEMNYQILNNFNGSKLADEKLSLQPATEDYS